MSTLAAAYTARLAGTRRRHHREDREQPRGEDPRLDGPVAVLVERPVRQLGGEEQAAAVDDGADRSVAV